MRPSRLLIAFASEGSSWTMSAARTLGTRARESPAGYSD
jgi:hypothetical protein